MRENLVLATCGENCSGDNATLEKMGDSKTADNPIMDKTNSGGSQMEIVGAGEISVETHIKAEDQHQGSGGMQQDVRAQLNHGEKETKDSRSMSHCCVEDIFVEELD